MQLFLVILGSGIVGGFFGYYLGEYRAYKSIVKRMREMSNLIKATYNASN